MWLLKDNSTHFIPVLAEIVNVSFLTGKFPDALNDTIISPIKKYTLDPNILKNFRPVSNIKIVEKIAEMATSSRLTEHFNQAPDSETSLMHVFFSSTCFRPSRTAQQQLGFLNFTSGSV